MFLNLILVFLIIVLLLALSMIWPPDSPWAPNWRTNKKTARAIIRFGKISKKDLVYDLGCGDAEQLIAVGRLGARGIGIEIDPLRAAVAKLRIKRNGLSKNVKIVRGNFFKHDISEATVVIVYLVPKALERLIPKFEKELKPGTKIISYKYKMNLNLMAEDKENELRMYRI